MTRDEAIEKYARAVHNPGSVYFDETLARAAPMIDAFVALFNVLDELGLKIVAK